MKTITPCLWFDDRAEEAAAFYTAIFPNSQVGDVTRYLADSPGGKSAGDVLTVDFVLDGQEFTALNGGPQFTFDEAISFQVPCSDQDEIDRYWAALSDGGQEGPCGWVTDRFGVSWQITPTWWVEFIKTADAESAQRAWGALMQMKKIDIAAIERAAAGE